jgi:hypothetical protein
MLSAELPAKERGLSRIILPLALWKQGSGRALFQNLHELGRVSDLRLGNEQVNVFRHDHVSDDHETVSLSHLFENREETIAAASGT